MIKPRHKFYVTPDMEALECAAETVLCQSPFTSSSTEEFGEEQTPSWF